MKRNYARRYANEFNIFRYLYQWIFCLTIALPMFWIFYKLEIRSRENLPKNGKFICAANHISELDPFMVSIAVRKPVAYMAKKELFEDCGTFVRLNMDWLGAFAVNREKLEASTIKTVKDLPKTNWLLGIFPQGGIRKNKTIENINKGFAVIAKAAKWDIVPISIIGCEKYNWIPFKSKVIITIGKPISYQLSEDELINNWGQQVANMSNYKFIPIHNETDSNKKTPINV